MMQYVLFNSKYHQYLLDANEFSILENWEENPIKELSDFKETEHPYYLCYGGYLLNPKTSDRNISEKLKLMEDFWLTAIDDYGQYCHQIAFYSVSTFSVISSGDQKIVPFAALIKSDGMIISKIADESGFSVTAFLRLPEWDIATNILNRDGIFALNEVEADVNENNWLQSVSESRAVRSAKNISGQIHC